MKAKQYGVDDLKLLTMLDKQIAVIEADLVIKCGEDFAEQLAAELLTEDNYERLMKVDDKAERRRVIVRAINEGINAGSINGYSKEAPWPFRCSAILSFCRSAFLAVSTSCHC